MKTTKTSQYLRMAQINKRAQLTILNRNSGFTLIEVIIVLAIITIVMSLGLPAISRITSQQLNSTTRKFVGMIRTIRNDSILLNTVHRLVLDFEHQSYWVEAQRGFELLSEAPEKKQKNPKKGEEPQSNFSMADKFSKKPIEMPSGIILEGLYKEKEGLVKKGVVYLHFFPNGFNDQGILYLNKEGAKSDGYSLMIRPTSGKVDIFRERVANFEK